MAEKSQKVKVAEYGSWSSPITAEVIVKEGGLPFAPIAELHTCCIDKQETIFWSELRSIESGRIVVCSLTKGQSDIVSWTPEEFNARTKVHEYGGGSTFVHKGHVYFSNFNDQRLYKQESPKSTPQALTPDGNGWRYADGEMVEFANKIICVREDHGVVERGEEKEAKNTIVCIDPVTQEQSVLVKGADFYSSPRVSSTGMIAWVQWNHPNMPWDTVEIWLGQLDASGEFLVEDSAKQIAFDEGVSVMLPRWTAEDSLFFISDRSDWWNLYEYISDTGEERNLFPIEKEIGQPHWIFGRCGYCPHPNLPSKVAAVYGAGLGILDSDLEKLEKIDTGFTSHSYPKYSPQGDKIYCVAGSTTRPYCVIEVDVESKKVVIIKDTKGNEVDPGYISEPKSITYPTEDNKVAHAYLYLPKNKDYSAPPGTLPPLLVKAHGGPTSSTSPAYDLSKQFFTSRGVAILDVNYRGSTGFGMHYRKELINNWGKVDVEDCCNGALYVANTMKAADVDKLCIDGGSAGGFTTLACLTQRNEVFKAGASKFGVSDIEALARDTHKFESRYMDSIVGPYPECKDLYIERSPIHSAESFNCPVIFFQGDEDKIVPPSQSETMFEVVKNKGLACAYVLYKGEQHGFRKSENIIATVEGEFCFFAKVFGYEPADLTCKLDIQNLKK